MVEQRAFAHAVLHHVLVAVWVGDPSVDQVRKFGAELEAVAEFHPSGIYVLNVITAGVGMPDQASRELLRQQFEGMRGRMRAAAIAIEQTGITATLSRAVISTLVTLTRRPFAVSILDHRSKAAQWLSQYPGVVAAEQLVDLANRLERQRA